MTESQFIQNNKKDWRRLEDLLESSNRDPEETQRLFVKVSGDLSYARSYYPRRAVRSYLNSLINTAFDAMRSREGLNLPRRIRRFYLQTLPRLVYQQRGSFMVAFAVFLVGVAIGALSLQFEPEFARQILGDRYVDMTEQNINVGDPMRVYKEMNETDMFLGITLNNIQVAFLTFVSGVFAGIGTLFVLIRNAVMVGVFQMFFVTKGLFFTSFLTIWIHGTIEISCIIIAGAAGLILGKGILFPGTYTRSVSMANAAIAALFVLLSTVPFFVIAGFLEGFVTRLTDLPVLVKLAIILGSLAAIAFVYIYLPYRVGRQDQFRNQLFIDREMTAEIDPAEMRSIPQGLFYVRKYFGALFLQAVLPAVVVQTLVVGVLTTTDEELYVMLIEQGVEATLIKHYAVFFLMVLLLPLLWVVVRAVSLYSQSIGEVMAPMAVFRNHPIATTLLALIATALLVSTSELLIAALMILAPYPALAFLLLYPSDRRDSDSPSDMVLESYGQTFVAMAFVGIMGLLLKLLFGTIVGQMLLSSVTWFTILNDAVLQNLLLQFAINSFIVSTMLVVLLPMSYLLVDRHYRKKYAVDLRRRMDQMTVLS